MEKGMRPPMVMNIFSILPQTKMEIEEQEDNIRQMEMAIKAKQNPLKLAETR